MNVKSTGQNTAFSTNKILNIRGSIIDLTIPRVMGILNVTPDSFYGASRVTSEQEMLEQAEKMLTAGATFIDVGGYSSRPGAKDVSEEEELSRTRQAVKLIAKNFPTAIISIDTFRSTVARQAIGEGAHLINDISAGELDTGMFNTLAELQVPYIVMHMRGTPQTMKGLTEYENLIKEITDYFHRKISTLRQLGVKDVIIDPGFGFSKTVGQNFQILQHLDYFKILGKPILSGLSRKSMIWKTLGITPEEALNGSSALHLAALLKGSSILRVHDVKEAMEVVKLYLNLCTGT